MCLAIVCVVALLPLLAINSRAEETTSTTEVTPTALEYPVSPLPFDYQTDVDYQTWNISTVAGTYSTPRKAGVYAYLTSVNNPKASTRTATEELYGLKTTVFVFKDVNAEGSLQYKPIYITQNINTFASLGSHQAPALIDTWFEFSNDCTLTIEYSWFDTVGANEFEPARYLNTQLTKSYRFVNANSMSGFTAHTLINEFAEYIDSHGYDSSSAFITHMSLKIDTAEFPCDYPTSSYCHIYVPLGDIDRTVDYMADNGSELNNDSELFDYYYDIGESAGHALGYQEGYDVGHSQGYNLGVSSNFDPGWFIEGVDAFLNLRLFQFAVGDTLVNFTLGTILSITLGGTALIWFLKLFAGG